MNEEIRIRIELAVAALRRHKRAKRELEMVKSRRVPELGDRVKAMARVAKTREDYLGARERAEEAAI